MTPFKVIVQDKVPKKLGAFLLKNGFSKRAVNNAKNSGGMLLVNHKRRFTNYMLHQGDEVIFIPGKERVNPWLVPSKKPLAVALETANYLVVNKPAGILSIPSRYDDNALVNQVLGYFNSKEEVDVKPHIVTRLDRDTSGLVLVGKNAIAHARFSQIDKTQFIKKYHAIVHGNFAPEELTGVIVQPIGRKGTSIVRSIDSTGKNAKTAYKVIAQKSGASLVELRLYTGRTHQIRIHMQYLGHPLFGDPLYGINDEFKRQALNCFYLGFPDPFTKGKHTSIEIPDAPDMQKLWHSL
ncbi:RluA family pseudouridine synthase [Lactobacillus melliventris]|uniref:RNA pseudouridylate synthase n=1 Tax=Lactobacillus melliventris TaxID=1218507 RepID=A0ABX5MZE9_9LACO|nr:RluA family pseudouridine synthase [Lactobacillus melliventris]PXY84240.1 RluA family pseudouridine synthase [Lactobacillus melliventris]